MNSRDLAHLKSLYDGEIAYTDYYIGKLMHLLIELGIDDHTLVVLTSDHGDEFFEHGGKGHFRTLFEEVLRVPLIVRFPDRQFASLRVDEVVSLVDIAPTVLDYIGVMPGLEMQGRSLIPLLTDEPGDSRSAYASIKEGRAALRTNDLKYIYNFNTGANRLFDLTEDPGEQENQLTAETDLSDPEVKAVIDGLVEWLNVQREYRQGLPSPPSEPNRAIDQNVVEELRALGYLD